MDSKILELIAKDYGTPTYVYDESKIRENFRSFRDAFKSRYEKVKIFYAYKANSNLVILKILAREGAKADTVSIGEILAALKVGLRGEDIIFTNNAKTEEEIEIALKNDVIINADSIQELYDINSIARRYSKKAKISIRVNPSIDAKTNPKIATGLKESKFGIHLDSGDAFKAYRIAKELDSLEIVGIHTHIGSQITSKEPFIEATEKLMAFVEKLKKNLNIELSFVNLGGGIGIKYRDDDEIPSVEEFAEAIVSKFKEFLPKLGYEPELWLEPGRYIVGNAGYLLCRVVNVKETKYKNFICVDAGFNVLLRPAMYDAYHRIEILGKENKAKIKKYDIVGNICESGDVFARDRELPLVEKGDILVIYDVGAYGFSMASNYNLRPRPAEVLVWENSAEIIRERESYEDLFSKQKIPRDLE